MKVSDFFSENVSPLLLGAFYSRYLFTNDASKIYTEVSYRRSKFVNNSSFLKNSKDLLLEKLNKICAPFSYWQDCTKNSAEKILIRFYLNNDLNLTKGSFYNRLNLKILSQEFIYDDIFNEDKKMFIRGFAESRGSVDTTRPLLAMDYFYNSANEVKRARMLYDYLNVPFSVLNFNPRELQDDFVTGRNKRNTQLRFNLYWYAKNIGFLNDYKVAIIEKVYKNMQFSHTADEVAYFNGPEVINGKKDTFDYMLRYYTNNIFGKKLTNFEINNLRRELNFDTDTDTSKFKRNQGLIEAIRMNTPDECASCKTTKTYTHKNTGRQYFEYHHVISIGQNHELDDEDNIVKLCPTCHRIVKKGSAPENEQKRVIRNILNNRPKVLSFAEHIYDLNNFEEIIDKIWQNLK